VVLRIALVLFAVVLGHGASAHAQSVDRPGVDDALHFGVSAGLAAGGYALGAVLFEPTPPRIALGGSIALAVGVAKELFDLTGLGTASWSDIAWDCAGIFMGLVVAWIVDELFFQGRGAAHTAGTASVSPQPGQRAGS
jgi:uncharacterized protein YfiM (DUF2279 family)